MLDEMEEIGLNGKVGKSWMKWISFPILLIPIFRNEVLYQPKYQDNHIASPF